MRLTNVFDGMSKENQFLRTVTKLLIIVCAALASIIIIICDREPIIVERSSHGLEIVTPKEFQRSASDLKEAVRLMMNARFSTDAVSSEIFLNQRQRVLRDTEQKEMKSRGLTQEIIVRNVAFDKDQAIVDLDRVLAVGDIRSALKAKVRITFEEVSPNELNPYGLLLSLADPIEQKEVKK